MDLWPLIAGLGLFLFGMTQLEGGLKELAGERFRSLIRQYSSTPLKGMFAGAGATMVLQSSSLVMVLVLAFVGAGVIDLRGALGVIYGANLGTTATGWLVATLGFKLDLSRAAMAFIGIGGIAAVLLPAGAWRQFGRVTIGLGLILLGLDQMKDGVEAWAKSVDVSPFSGHGRLVLALCGLLLTAVIQSSSGTMMITLSALHGGIIDLPGAAALAVGSNVGSTLTAVLGSLGGSADKKRVAAGHVLFNSITAVVALIFLGPLLALVSGVGDPLIALVLFHSLFNVLGILLFLPFTRTFASILEQRFALDPGRAGRYISRVEPTVVEAALEALERETQRALSMAMRLNKHALKLTVTPAEAWQDHEDEASGHRMPYLERYERLKRLESEAIAFAAKLQARALDPAQVERLHNLLQACRDAVLAAKGLKDVREDLVRIRHQADAAIADPGSAMHAHAEELYRGLQRLAPGTDSALVGEELERMRQRLRDHHRQVLETIYAQAAKQNLGHAELSSLLNLNGAVRRAHRALLRSVGEFLLPASRVEALGEAD